MEEARADTSGWHVITVRSDRAPVPGLPADLWEREWRSMGVRIWATEPTYSRQHSLNVYELDTDDGPITFATGEVANTFYLFAAPDALR